MVAPITGPFTESLSEPFADVQRTRYRQRPPYTSPLPFRFVRNYGRTNGSSDYLVFGPDWKDTSWSPRSAFTDARMYQACYNKAYERLKGELSDNAGWAENIAQAGQARKMFNTRATQLARFATAVAGRNFRHAAAILGHPEMSVGTSRRKKAAQNFLEYEYGLKPLMNDLEDSMKILTSDPGFHQVKSSANETMYFDHRVASATGYETDRWHSKLKVKLQADVYIDNPNLFLANQLGLLDLALPWKLIPFSFIVDWFVNVEQVISSTTDWFGCSLSNSFHTIVYRGSRKWVQYSTWQENPTWRPYVKYVRDYEGVDIDRVMGFPGPSLVIRPFQGFSVERGAQAISLVLAVLGK